MEATFQMVYVYFDSPSYLPAQWLFPVDYLSSVILGIDAVYLDYEFCLVLESGQNSFLKSVSQVLEKTVWDLVLTAAVEDHLGIVSVAKGGDLCHVRHQLVADSHHQIHAAFAPSQMSLALAAANSLALVDFESPCFHLGWMFATVKTTDWKYDCFLEIKHFQNLKAEKLRYLLLCLCLRQQ